MTAPAAAPIQLGALRRRIGSLRLVHSVSPSSENRTWLRMIMIGVGWTAAFAQVSFKTPSPFAGRPSVAQ
jgi:hypothetical protein